MASPRIVPRTTAKLRVGAQHALSSEHNPRNLKAHWYGPWNHVLYNIVQARHDLLVSPQRHLYIDEESPGSDSSFHPLSSKAPETAAMSSTSSSHSVASQTSSIGTETVTNGCRTVIADFAIIHVPVEDIDILDDHYDGGQVLDITAPLVLEVTRNTERADSACETVDDIAGFLVEAQAQVLKKAAYAFGAYRRMETTIAIAASGPWWTYAIVSRQDVKRELEFLPSEERMVVWSPTARLGTPPSHQLLAEVTQRLMKIAGEIM